MSWSTTSFDYFLYDIFCRDIVSWIVAQSVRFLIGVALVSVEETQWGKEIGHFPGQREITAAPLFSMTPHYRRCRSEPKDPNSNSQAQ